MLLLPNRLGVGMEEEDVAVVVAGLLAIKENVEFGAEEESVGGGYKYLITMCSAAQKDTTHVLHMNTIFGSPSYSEWEAQLFSALNMLMFLEV